MSQGSDDVAAGIGKFVWNVLGWIFIIIICIGGYVCGN